MRVLCAPAPFKESLRAAEVAAAMAAGISDLADDGSPVSADACPVADGGDGTLDALVAAADGEFRNVSARGPLTRPPQHVTARFGLIETGRVAVVELASASGFTLVPPCARDPMRTTTYGTGEVIAAAIATGAAEIIIGIGGSATVDGGAGLVQALGGRIFDAAGGPIEDPLTGADLQRIARVEPPRDLPRLRVACDVGNPLLGPDGAATVYGPQKGATPAQVAALEAGLAHLASLFPEVDPAQPGAGASGGAGFGLAAMCGATLEPGVDLVLEAVQFDARCREADLVLTGEGRLDGQSLQGKAVIGVARAAARLDVPAIAIVGRTGPGVERCWREHGGPLENVVSLAERFGMDAAMARPAALIQHVVASILRQRSA